MRPKSGVMLIPWLLLPASHARESAINLRPPDLHAAPAGTQLAPPQVLPAEAAPGRFLAGPNDALPMAPLLGACDVVAVATGNASSYALKGDGTVRSWGWGMWGQLGDGSSASRSTPGRVSGLTDVTGIAASSFHCLALRSDGTVWSWGYNVNGQLGDGTTAYRDTAGPVPGLTDVRAISVSMTHSLALKGDGTVWAWGWNGMGETGDGTTTTRLVPVQAIGLTDVIAVAAGQASSYALKGDGTVWSWGINEWGQLGDGTTTDRLTAAPVIGLPHVTAIAASDAHALALGSDGTVWAWGWNNWGQLGDGTLTNRHAPVPVSSLTDVRAIVASGDASWALTTDGTAWGWGANLGGGFGDGTTSQRQWPAPALGLTGVTAIAGNGASSLALTDDGRLWGCGDNFWGQVGDGTTISRLMPVPVTFPGEPPISIACPPAATVECGGDTSPAATGQATATGGCGVVALSHADVVTPGCGGSFTIARTFTATDGTTNRSCTQRIDVIDTTAPVMVAGSIAGCYPTVAAAEAAALAATTVSDGCDAAVSKTASTAGTCFAIVTVTAADGCGNAASVTYSTRIDGEAPTIAASRAVVACLWPPNHRMERVRAADLRPVITDNCSGPTSWILSGCASDQPDDARGDGSTERDCIVAADGSWVELRAERQGMGDAPRHYTLVVTATDACGNISAPAPAFLVVVPHDASPEQRCP